MLPYINNVVKELKQFCSHLIGATNCNKIFQDYNTVSDQQLAVLESWLNLDSSDITKFAIALVHVDKCNKIGELIKEHSLKFTNGDKNIIKKKCTTFNN